MHVDDVRMRSWAITILKPVSHCRKSVTLFSATSVKERKKDNFNVSKKVFVVRFDLISSSTAAESLVLKTKLIMCINCLG